MLTNLSIVGAGGHAQVVVESLQHSGRNFEINIFDEDRSIEGMFLGTHLITCLQDINQLDSFFHVAIGSNRERSRISQRAIQFGKIPLSIMHKLATVFESAKISDGVFLAANSIVASEAVVGVGSIVNHAAIVDHNCTIGSYSHVAPNATLGGGVNVGSQCLIGAGATILPNVTIGSFSIIGAGSVVTKDVPENSVVFGNPAIRRFYESN